MKNKVIKFLTLGATASLLAAMIVVPAAAQDATQAPTAGQGGTIIEGNFGGDPKSLNPIIDPDTSSQRIISLIFPGFLGVDPSTGLIAPNQPDSLVKTWDMSADGLTYTFHLRDDMKWSDGTPITGKDMVYVWNAIKAGAAGQNSAAASFLYDSTGKSGITDVSAPDDATVVIKFAQAACSSLFLAGDLGGPVPSHVMPTDLSTLDDWDGNLNPPVTYGPFNFAGLRPGEQVSLSANPNYVAPDALQGAVIPSGYIYKNVPDANVLVEQFLANQTNFIDNPDVARRADVRASNSQVFNYPGNAWDYLAFNLADPSNPQSALDDKGNPIDQGHHPLFGDVAVRQALSHAIDVDAMIKAAVFNEGTRMTSFLIPTLWAYDKDLPPITFDQKLAGQMLDQAGWIDDDNDVSTPRVAKGAKYAPDGTKFEFTLYTNDGNTRRTAIGQLVQDQLAQIGVKVDFQTIDFNTLLDLQNQQTFDATILGWRDGYPDDPDSSTVQLFSPQGDVVGNGSNFTSYDNPDFNKLLNQVQTVPGCDTPTRQGIYNQMQQIFQQDVPYIPLFDQNGMYAAGANVDGFDPQPSNPLWNVDEWNVKATP